MFEHTHDFTRYPDYHPIGVSSGRYSVTFYTQDGIIKHIDYDPAVTPWSWIAQKAEDRGLSFDSIPDHVG